MYASPGLLPKEDHPYLGQRRCNDGRGHRRSLSSQFLSRDDQYLLRQKGGSRRRRPVTKNRRFILFLGPPVKLELSRLLTDQGYLI